ncbi:hypothetical protein JOM56_011341 [Amanita muscaria]
MNVPDRSVAASGALGTEIVATASDHKTVKLQYAGVQMDRACLRAQKRHPPVARAFTKQMSSDWSLGLQAMVPASLSHKSIWCIGRQIISVIWWPVELRQENTAAPYAILSVV